MKTKISIFCAVLARFAMAEDSLPIIDMHIHSYGENAPYGNKDPYGNAGPESQKMHFRETYDRFKKHNIVKAVVSGSLDSVDKWKSWDTEDRIIRGLWMQNFNDDNLNSERFEELVKSGKVEVFGEIGAYYSGTTLSDPGWQPYLAICEKYDIPVAVHTGGGDPGGTHSRVPKARLELGDPYLVENVLVKYPKLRLYLMHAGEVWHEHTLRLMAYYTNLYADVAVLLWVEPLVQRYGTEFLRNAKQAGYLDRVMYGSDQMFWPAAIDRSIEFLNSLEFLTEVEKRGILYDNAARFLRIEGK